jgi:hypothetical protein
VQTRGAPFARRGALSRAPRDAVGGIRGARRHVRGSVAAWSAPEGGENDGRGETEKRKSESEVSGRIEGKGQAGGSADSPLLLPHSVTS